MAMEVPKMERKGKPGLKKKRIFKECGKTFKGVAYT